MNVCPMQTLWQGSLTQLCLYSYVPKSDGIAGGRLGCSLHFANVSLEWLPVSVRLYQLASSPALWFA